MSHAKRTFESILWNHGGRILEYILMYSISVVIARSLGVRDNGYFVGFISLSQLLLVFSSFGLETSLNKFIPQLQGSSRIGQTRMILRRVLLIRIGIFALVVVVLLTLFYVIDFPLKDTFSSYVWVLVIYAGMRAIIPILSTLLTAQFRTSLTAKINVFVRVIELAGIIILASAHFGMMEFILLFLATNTLHLLLYVLFTRNQIMGETENVELRPIVLFGAIFWMNSIVDFVLGRQGDILFLTSLLPDASQGSLYDVAYSVGQLASLAFTVGLSGVMLATFARLAVGPAERLDRFYMFSVRFVSILTIPAFAFLLFNSAPLIHILYSAEYVGSVLLIQWLMMFRLAARLFAGGENAEYLLSKGNVSGVVYIGIIAATINVGLNISLIPILGAMGAVIAGGTSNVLVNFLGFLLVRKDSTCRMQLAYWSKLVLFCVIASFAVVTFVEIENSAAVLVIRACVYGLLVVGALYLIKPLTRQDMEWIGRIDARAVGFIRPFSEGQEVGLDGSK